MIGAERYERTEDRLTERHGTRPHLLSTKAGDIELKIPKLRKGSFFPSILEPPRRIDQALYAVVMEAYVYGVSTRTIDDLNEKAYNRSASARDWKWFEQWASGLSVISAPSKCRSPSSTSTR